PPGSGTPAASSTPVPQPAPSATPSPITSNSSAPTSTPGATTNPTPASQASAAPASTPEKPLELDKPVESTTLQNIDPEAIGLLAPEDGGLGASMWKGTSRELVERLLPALTLPTDAAALNELAERFLLTTANV